MHFNASISRGTSILGRYSKPETLTFDVLYVEQDDLFQRFHDWGRLSTVPVLVRYSKAETLAYDVPYVKQDDAFQRFYFSGHFHFGALQQAWNVDIWRSICRTRRSISTLPWLGALVNSSIFGALQQAPWHMTFYMQNKTMHFNPFISRGACQHFHFGSATASLKHWHKTRQCISMLPWLGALVNTSVLGALQQAWNIGIRRSICRTRCISTLPWLGALINCFFLGAPQQAWNIDNITFWCKKRCFFSPKFSFTPPQVHLELEEVWRSCFQIFSEHAFFSRQVVQRFVVNLPYRE